MLKLKPADKSELPSLVDAEAYQKLIESQAARGHDQLQPRCIRITGCPAPRPAQIVLSVFLRGDS
jgi:hypothetical protein